jgi:hypothetical protein
MPYHRSKSKGKPPKPYRSWLEHNLGTGVLKDLPYEPFTIPYTITTSYKPDFINEEKKIIFEAKGRFKDSAEAAKYIHFRNSNPEWTVIFIFERPECPMPHTRKRKDGTRYRHKDWADKNGFLWCSPSTVKEEWL